MRPKLLQSFIIVVLFWLIASTIWWSFQRPAVNLEALTQLKRLLPFLPFEVPKEAGILASLGVQWKVLMYWSAPVGLLTLMSGAVGYGLLWLKAQRTSDARDGRETGHGEFRGLTVTLGDLPTPKALPRDNIELSAADDESLARLTSRELKLLGDIFGTISAHPDAYSGEGVLSSLLDHTLNIASKALASPRNAGLAAIVAAANEMGKITAFRKDKEGQWVPAKKQDKEAARILGMLDSWFALPTQERLAVMMAVKFHSTPRLLPEIDSDPAIYKLARDLLSTAEVTTSAIVVQEKQKTLDSARALTGQELPDVIFDALLSALPALSFQSRGLPKGVAAVAWKVGSRVYLLEIKLRETVLNKLPADVRGALMPNPKERSRLQPFTVELLKALDARGWLVKEIQDVKLDTKDAVWNIKAGKLDFKGVIVVEVPDEFKTQLPNDDSMYEVSVTGPLFSQNAGGMQVSKQDLMGSVLKPPSAERVAALAQAAPTSSNPPSAE
jgi:hypothetical protein